MDGTADAPDGSRPDRGGRQRVLGSRNRAARTVADIIHAGPILMPDPMIMPMRRQDGARELAAFHNTRRGVPLIDPRVPARPRARDGRHLIPRPAGPAAMQADRPVRSRPGRRTISAGG